MADVIKPFMRWKTLVPSKTQKYMKVTGGDGGLGKKASNGAERSTSNNSTRSQETMQKLGFLYCNA